MVYKYSSFITFLLAFYVFLSPLGNLMRSGGAESSLGISTAVLFFLVFFSIKGIFKGLIQQRIFLLIGILIIWMIYSSFFAYDKEYALFNSITLIIYLSLAIISYFYIKSTKNVYFLLVLLCIGGLISSASTIIDSLGIIDIPGVNEVTAVADSESGKVSQFSGPFLRRTAMASYYSLVITVSFLLIFLYPTKRKFIKILCSITALLCIASLMLTHNRSGITASVLTLLFAIIFCNRFSLKKSFYLISIGILFFLLIFFIVEYFFPSTFDVYLMLFRLGDAFTHSSKIEESDNLRSIFFFHSLFSIANNPFGHGYSLMNDVPGFYGRLIDPHGNINQIIWGAGIFGLIWMVVVFILAINKIRYIYININTKNINYRLILILFFSIITFVLNGLMHTTLSTGLAWVLFGALLKMIKINKYNYFTI